MGYNDKLFGINNRLINRIVKTSVVIKHQALRLLVPTPQGRLIAFVALILEKVLEKRLHSLDNRETKTRL